MWRGVTASWLRAPGGVRALEVPYPIAATARNREAPAVAGGYAFNIVNRLQARDDYLYASTEDQPHAHVLQAGRSHREFGWELLPSLSIRVRSIAGQCPDPAELALRRALGHTQCELLP